MNRTQLVNQVETIAHCARLAGHTVKINHLLPYVAVFLGYNEYGDAIEYFFQGEEASELLDEVPDYLNEEDYILWTAQGW